jgi:hypothetical protein
MPGIKVSWLDMPVVGSCLGTLVSTPDHIEWISYQDTKVHHLASTASRGANGEFGACLLLLLLLLLLLITSQHGQIDGACDIAWNDSRMASDPMFMVVGMHRFHPCKSIQAGAIHPSFLGNNRIATKAFRALA